MPPRTIIIGSSNINEADRETGTAITIVIVPKGINIPTMPSKPPIKAKRFPNFLPDIAIIPPIIPKIPQSKVHITLRYINSIEKPTSAHVNAAIAKLSSIEVIEIKTKYPEESIIIPPSKAKIGPTNNLPLTTNSFILIY